MTYSYDAAGRIMSMGGSFADTNLPSEMNATHGIDHRLSTQNSDSFTYDAGGAIQTRTDVCGTTTYTWNVRGQLTAISGFGPAPACATVTASFVYDALGRRQAKTINGITTSFTYDGMTPIQEKQGSTTINLLTGPGIDEYLARTDTSTTRYFLPNHLGSTLALTDPAGAITTRYTYSPFGETTQSGEVNANTFQYTARENDQAGLYYYRARYYDPKIQRFISSDPIGLPGGLNTYGYANQNPLRYTDPLGLWSFSFGAYFGIGGAILFGQDPTTDQFFYGGRLGFGLGGGGSFDYKGRRPGGDNGTNCDHGTTYGDFVNVGGSIGPYQWDPIDAHAGYDTTTGLGYHEGPLNDNITFGAGGGGEVGGAFGIEVVGH